MERSSRFEKLRQKYNSQVTALQEVKNGVRDAYGRTGGAALIIGTSIGVAALLVLFLAVFIWWKQPLVEPVDTGRLVYQRKDIFERAHWGKIFTVLAVAGIAHLVGATIVRSVSAAVVQIQETEKAPDADANLTEWGRAVIPLARQLTPRVFAASFIRPLVQVGVWLLVTVAGAMVVLYLMSATDLLAVLQHGARKQWPGGRSALRLILAGIGIAYALATLLTQFLVSDWIIARNSDADRWWLPLKSCTNATRTWLSSAVIGVVRVGLCGTVVFMAVIENNFLPGAVGGFVAITGLLTPILVARGVEPDKFTVPLLASDVDWSRVAAVVFVILLVVAGGPGLRLADPAITQDASPPTASSDSPTLDQSFTQLEQNLDDITIRSSSSLHLHGDNITEGGAEELKSKQRAVYVANPRTHEELIVSLSEWNATYTDQTDMWNNERIESVPVTKTGQGVRMYLYISDTGFYRAEGVHKNVFSYAFDEQGDLTQIPERLQNDSKMIHTALPRGPMPAGEDVGAHTYSEPMRDSEWDVERKNESAIVYSTTDTDEVAAMALKGGAYAKPEQPMLSHQRAMRYYPRSTDHVEDAQARVVVNRTTGVPSQISYQLTVVDYPIQHTRDVATPDEDHGKRTPTNSTVSGTFSQTTSITAPANDPTPPATPDMSRLETVIEMIGDAYSLKL